jgi:hypothetical protein
MGNDNAAEGNHAGDPLTSDLGDPCGRRHTRRQTRLTELEFARAIKIQEPKRFTGTPNEDFNTQWVTMQVYIEDQPERFPKEHRTIGWIGSVIDKYAAACHIQWIKGTLSGAHAKLLSGYVPHWPRLPPPASPAHN